jgi:benzoyl-CoA 2,3-dioxygenase component B
MFVGETGVSRVLQRTADLMNRVGTDPAKIRAEHAIDLPTVQRYLNHWYTSSLDLFGGERSSNAADFFASGLKGRYNEERCEDHIALAGEYDLAVRGNDGAMHVEKVPLRNAMNEVLRDGYVGDCEFVCQRWNRVLEKAGRAERLELPSRRFRRAQGIYADACYDPKGNPITNEAFEAHRAQWLPSKEDLAYVQSLMHPVTGVGQIASWIAPPAKGIDEHPFAWEYVKPPHA